MSHIRKGVGPLFQRQYDQAAPIVNAEVNVGDITIGGFTEGVLVTDWVEVTAAGATVIPLSAGAFNVEIINVGGTVDGTAFGAIVITGTGINETLQSGGEWENPTQIDYTTSPATQYFTPEITVTNSTGSAFRYRVTRPA